MKGRVTLFVVKEKNKPTAPDLDGKIVLDNGEIVYINLWKEETRAGGFFYKGLTKPDNHVKAEESSTTMDDFCNE